MNQLVISTESPRKWNRPPADKQLEMMRVKLNILEVQSEIDLPDVKWRVMNAMGQFPFCFFSFRTIVIPFQCSEHGESYS
jgi:hypothetical protein